MLLEFTVMLVIAVILSLAVLVLSGAVADEGDRMVNLVRAAVP